MDRQKRQRADQKREHRGILERRDARIRGIVNIGTLDESDGSRMVDTEIRVVARRAAVVVPDKQDRERSEDDEPDDSFAVHLIDYLHECQSQSFCGRAGFFSVAGTQDISDVFSPDLPPTHFQ